MARRVKSTTPEVLDVGEVHQETRRGAKGRWLPGVQPVGAKAAVMIGETRERFLEALFEGEGISQSLAQSLGVGEKTLWRAVGDDEELRTAYLRSQEMRRWKWANQVAEVTNNVMAASQKEATSGTSRDRKDNAIAIGTLLDAHAKAAGLANAPTHRMRLAVSDKVLALEVT